MVATHTLSKSASILFAWQILGVMSTTVSEAKMCSCRLAHDVLEGGAEELWDMAFPCRTPDFTFSFNRHHIVLARPYRSTCFSPPLICILNIAPPSPSPGLQQQPHLLATLPLFSHQPKTRTHPWFARNSQCVEGDNNLHQRTIETLYDYYRVAETFGDGHNAHWGPDFHTVRP